jgi:diguanylate cyclase
VAFHVREPDLAREGAMSVFRARALELAAVLAVVALAGLQIWVGLGDAWRAFLAVAGSCAGLIGIAAGELATSPEPAPPPTPEAVLKEAMDRVLNGIRGYLEGNLTYRADLEGIDAGLANGADPARSIAALRSANQRMEEQSAHLTQELEAARREIHALRETVEEVERLALVDELTQIGNRRFFDQTLEADMAACIASGADLCLAIADIDRFKSVNDTFGHVVGDHLLKAFAEMLTSRAKGRGKAARYGGEEFALLFPGVPFPEARRIVESLRRDLEARRWVVGPNEQPLGAVTASFGLARFQPGESAESFVHRADSRLLRAKALGRNRVAAEEAARVAS